MAPVVHFEITADDVERACRFYEIFGWQIAGSGAPGTEYRLVRTGEGSPGIDGAIMPRAYNAQAVVNWVSVGDLDDMVGRVEAAGGRVVGERHTVPGVGYTVCAEDTEGNTFGMVQPVPSAAMGA